MSRKEWLPLFLSFQIFRSHLSSPEPKAPGHRQAPFSAGSRNVVGNASDT